MPASVFEARNLELAWGGLEIAEDVSLSVGEGELVCIVGRSGCGKSTLFHTLAGLGRPVSGKVLLHGRDITGMPGHVSYMLQKDLLLPSRSILDNAALPLMLRGVDRAEARSRARELFGTFGLEGTEDLWPAQLSGGMRQRAALLRTYLMENDVVLLDEPFSALDAITRVELRRWFKQMIGELDLSALVITHDVDEAVDLARRAYVLDGNPRKGIVSHLSDEIPIDASDIGSARGRMLGALSLS